MDNNTRDEMALKLAGDILRGPGRSYDLPDAEDPDEVATDATNVATFAYAIADALIARSNT